MSAVFVNLLSNIMDRFFEFLKLGLIEDFLLIYLFTIGLEKKKTHKKKTTTKNKTTYSYSDRYYQYLQPKISHVHFGTFPNISF